MRIRFTAALAVTLCLATGGCTTTSQGEPKPVPTNEASTTEPTSPPTGNNDDLPSNGAPKVEDPLDTARFEQDPCSTLTTAQTKELNLPADGEKEEIPYGIGCIWRNPTTRASLSIGILTDIEVGLSGFYAADQRGEYSYFIPLPDIENYPAVATDSNDRRSEGVCIVLVGVTDQVAVQFSLHLSQANVHQKDPCNEAADVAEKALQTMKEAT